MGMAYKAPPPTTTSRWRVSSAAIRSFRALVDREFAARDDKDLAFLLDERVRAAMFAGAFTQVEDVNAVGIETSIVRIENRSGSDLFAVVRGGAIVTVLDEREAKLSRERGLWRPPGSGDAGKVEAPPSAKPQAASPAIRLGWARDEWRRDPDCPVVGENGMLKRMLARFGEAASSDVLYRTWSEVKAAIEREAKSKERSKPIAASLAPKLQAALDAPKPEPKPAPVAKPAPKLTIARSPRELAEEEVAKVGRYWPNVADAWTKEEHDAVCELVRANIEDPRELQLRLAATTKIWRKAGAIMLHIRPLEFVLPGSVEAARAADRLGRENRKRREQQEVLEAKLYLEDRLDELPPFVMMDTAVKLTGNRNRFHDIDSAVDIETDAIVWPRDPIVELHRRVVAAYGRVTSEPLRAGPKVPDAELDEVVFRQVREKPGTSVGALSGGDSKRVSASVERLVSAGRISKHPSPSGRNGFVVGPIDWTPPKPEPKPVATPKPRVKIERVGGYDPAKGPRHPDNQDPTLEAPRRETAEIAPVNGTAEAIAEVYRALRAKEIDAAMAAEMIKALKGGA